MKNLWILALLLLGASHLRAQPTPPAPETLVAPFLKKHKSGEQTLDAAWEAGQLNSELVLAALGSQNLVNAGVALPSGDMKLASDLSRVLVQNSPQTLEKLGDFSERALLHLANYFRSKRDARAVTFYEEVLQRQPKRVPEWPWQVDAALYNLGNYYAETGQTPKAIATTQRIYEYTTNAPLLANFELHLGSYYSQIGDKEKAAQAYQTAEEIGSAREAGVARMDRSNNLFGQGKIAEARALLLQPLAKLSPEESRKQPIQIALLTSLAQSYYQEKDLETAARYAKEAVKLFENLTEIPTDAYVVAYGPEAKGLLTRIETRQNAPFYWNEDQIVLLHSPREYNPGSQRLVLQFKVAPQGEVTFKCEHPAIRIEPVIASAPNADPLQRVVYVSLMKGKIEKEFSAKLIAESGNAKTEIPIRVWVVREEQTTTEE